MTQTKHSSESGIVETFRRTDTASQPKWLMNLRNSGISTFAELGFPTLHDEDWRFTNVGPIAALPFNPAPAVAVNGAESNVLGKAAFGGLAGNRLVFVNGFFQPKLSRVQALPGGAAAEHPRVRVDGEPGRPAERLPEAERAAAALPGLPAEEGAESVGG